MSLKNLPTRSGRLHVASDLLEQPLVERRAESSAGDGLAPHATRKNAASFVHGDANAPPRGT